MVIRIAILLATFLALGLAGEISAEPVSTLLERAVYVEETAGDIDKAIELYRQIIASAETDRPYLAQAHYRLGMCLAKKGRNEEAVAAFKKVVSQYGDQDEVVSKAAEQLRKLDHQPLAIQPAPWADGEVMRLRLTAAAGGEIGTIIYTADATESDGRKLWLIRSHLLVTITNTFQDTVVEADRDSFAPVTGRTLNNDMGDYRAVYDYGPDRVMLTTISNTGGKSARTIDLDQPVYDNEQVIYLLRRLPLAQGYRASFMIFPVMGGSLAECRIEIVGTEKVTVPAGTYDCYRMNLSVWAGTTKALEHQLWFSQDAGRHLVKYDSGSALMELAEVSKVSGEPTAFSDPQLGIAFTGPAGWFVYRHPGEQQGKIIFQLLSPEPGHWSLLAVSAGIMEFLGDMNVRQVAEGDIEILKGYFKNYVVREASWKDLQVGGLPAARFEADYKDNDAAMVEYRTYILSAKGVYWFVFRTDKDEFDAQRPKYDQIVDSFRATASSTQPARPVVIGTSPETLVNDVSPSLKEISVTFDRPMMNLSWSWVGGGETYPKTTGKPRYEATRTTCSLPVDLEPGKVYWVGINSKKFTNFQTEDHVPAVPWVILFATRGEDGRPTPIPEDMHAEARRINEASLRAASLPSAMRPVDKKAAENFRAKGWQLWSSRQFAEAEAAFVEATRAEPDNANGWQGLGWSQFNQGKQLQAKESFEKCVALEPNNAAALNGLGWLAKAQNNNDEAIGYWKKAVQADPKATAALRGLAITHMERKEYAPAARYFEMWLKAEPNNAEARQGLRDAKAAGNGRPPATNTM